MQQLFHVYHVSRRDQADVKSQLELLKKAMGRRIEVQVTDRSHSLLFQIDALKRELAAEKEAMSKLRETLREEAKKEYEDVVQKLTAELLASKGSFEDFKLELQGKMKEQLQDLKKEKERQLMNSSSTPLELKRMLMHLLDGTDVRDLEV